MREHVPQPIRQLLSPLRRGGSRLLRRLHRFLGAEFDEKAVRAVLGRRYSPYPADDKV